MNEFSVNYIWSKNGKVIDVEPTLSESGVSTLRLPSVRGHHSGTIECAAVTDVDVKISGIQVLVKGIVIHGN